MSKKLREILLGLAGGLTLLFLVLFGNGLLDNVHNLYLRVLSNYVVKITNSTGRSGATGFVVKGDSGEKYIMTNAHVCGLAEDGKLTAEYMGDKFKVEVYKFYAWNDLCALKAHRSLGFAVNIADSFFYGETTYVIGHPLLEPKTSAVGELSGPVTIQIVMKENPKPEECQGPTYSIVDLSDTMYSMLGINSVCIRTLDALGSTMSIQPGNSGSPAVNIFGSVVAVAFASNGEGRSYFVSLADLKDFLRQL